MLGGGCRSSGYHRQPPHGGRTTALTATSHLGCSSWLKAGAPRQSSYLGGAPASIIKSVKYEGGRRQMPNDPCLAPLGKAPIWEGRHPIKI